MERKINILVVDDEQIILDSVQKHLRKDDYEVYCALNVDEGVAIMDRVEIDIVLTDLMMPVIDGLEFMKMIKKSRPALPVIMITGYATINTALQATQLGAFDYIAKPFSKAELVNVIRRAAELVIAANSEGNRKSDAPPADRGIRSQATALKTIGDQSWLRREKSGQVLLGVERSYLRTIGRIQAIFLPSVGDELRQGSVYLQIFSSDLRSHTVMSPLSGTVVEVNEKAVSDPEIISNDPHGEGWLVKINPSKYDYEIKHLGL